MVIKKPLVLGSDDVFAEELSSVDTLSTENIVDSLNKRFVTDAEKAAIGTINGDPLYIQPDEPAGSCLWIQTNVDNDPNSFMVWVKE